MYLSHNFSCFPLQVIRAARTLAGTVVPAAAGVARRSCAFVAVDTVGTYVKHFVHSNGRSGEKVRTHFKTNMCYSLMGNGYTAKSPELVTVKWRHANKRVKNTFP